VILLVTNSPAEIVQQLLVDLVDEWGGTDWPLFVDNEPDSPDDAITVYNTDGLLNARLQNTGEFDENPGIQIRIRSAEYTDGWTIADAIKAMLDEDVYGNVVAVLDGGDFEIETFNRSSNVLAIGREPESQRWVFTLNGTIVVNELES
jgi:hypothetical protein